MFALLARALRQAPLFLPLLAVIGALLAQMHGTVWVLLTLAAIILALPLRLYKIATAAFLIASLAGLHLSWREQRLNDGQHQLLAQDELYLKGTLVRVAEKSAFMALDDYYPLRVELRGSRVASLCKYAKLGDVYEVWGVAEPLSTVSAHPIPGQFERGLWLRRHAVVCELSVFEAHALEPLFSWARFRSISEDWRMHLAAIIMPAGTEADAARQLLCALLLGEKSLAEPATLEAFVWSGSMHALAVSGLHVGILAALLWMLARVLRLPPRWAVIAIVVALALYVFVTGMAVSAIRAFLMTALLMLGLYAKRQISLLNIWSAAALMILLIAPPQLLQAGFVLSFVIYAVILMAARLSMIGDSILAPDDYLPPRLYTRWDFLRRWLGQSLRAVFWISTLAWILSLPLMALYFDSINSYGFLTNICITPLLPFVMGAGLLMLAFAPIPYLGSFFAAIALKLSAFLFSICSFFAGLPSAYLPTCAAAAGDSYMLVDLGYGKSACILGNPGLLLGAITPQSERWRLRPALFASGYSPSLMLQDARPSSRKAGGDIKRLWPALQILPMASMPPRPQLLYSAESGRFIIYPSPQLMQRPVSDDKLAILLWEYGDKRLLYLGNASAATLHYWIEQGADLRADIAILGHNPKQAVLDLDGLGIKQLILLPNAPAHWQGLRLGENEARKGQLTHSPAALSK